ncbi:hypothetical protein CHELA1G11_70025 [Hyphomicrobiales bacterium]|nr:hypothetical protein CHELA1G2_60011 [Hyphomicrobiales bacterium]CAH1696919.1 hypothetical protein CHELA1G11_70025 [Hyphomicrobiales bacterium]
MRTICSAAIDSGGRHAIIEYKGYRGRLVPPDPEAGLPCYRIEPVEGPSGYWEGAIACASPDVAEKQFQLAVRGHIRVGRYRRARQRGPRPFRWLNLGEWAQQLGIERDVVASLRREDFADTAGVRALSLTLYQRPRRVTRAFVDEFSQGVDDDHLIDMLLPDVWVPERLCQRWLGDRAIPVAKVAQPAPDPRGPAGATITQPETSPVARPTRSVEEDFKAWVEWWELESPSWHPGEDIDREYLKSCGHVLDRDSYRLMRSEFIRDKKRIRSGARVRSAREAFAATLNRAKEYFRRDSALLSA